MAVTAAAGRITCIYAVAGSAGRARATPIIIITVAIMK